MIIFLAAIAPGGCASAVPVAPGADVRAVRVPLAAAPGFGGKYILHIVPDPETGGESILHGHGGARYILDHVEWSEEAADCLTNEMARRGAEISGGGKLLRVRIDGAVSSTSGDRITVEVRSTVGLMDGSWSKTFSGSETVVYSALLAFQGAMADLHKNILSNREMRGILAGTGE
ncbi:MAG: hypothetical protein ACYS8W_21365 [Planctomycetota bacterium]|jgi:hypothetical protein